MDNNETVEFLIPIRNGETLINLSKFFRLKVIRRLKGSLVRRTISYRFGLFWSHQDGNKILQE